MSAKFKDTESCGSVKLIVEQLTNDQDVREPILELELEEIQKPATIAKKIHTFVLKPLLLLLCLYFFICSLDLMSRAFQLIGSRLLGATAQLASSTTATNFSTTGNSTNNDEVKSSMTGGLSNPFAGLMIGMLMTVLLQSSSTTTSIIITMIATNIIQLSEGIYMIMGANIGTSVTNTIVALMHMGNRCEFQLSFAGATVHDMFNWLTVIILLPLEVATGYLNALSRVMVNSLHVKELKMKKISLLNTITKPLTNRIVAIDKKILTNPELLASSKSIIKICNNSSKQSLEENSVVTICNEKRNFLFMSVAGVWNDSTIGAIILALSLLLLSMCLISMVRTLKSIFLEHFVHEVQICTAKKRPCAVLEGIVAILIGCGMTILVQSSSVFTSALTPLVGTGLLSLERMFALTMGANVGTTVTGLLSALAQDVSRIDIALQAAFVHLLFNITGILLWYPIPVMRRVPIGLATRLGHTTYKYRWFAVIYLVIFFMLLPMLVFALSLAHWIASMLFCCLLLLLFVCIVVLNLLQHHCSPSLPPILRSWDFLPAPLRSLRPYDRLLTKLACCRICRQLQPVAVVAAFAVAAPEDLAI